MALPGLLALGEQALRDGARALVIACFDDTGLDELRASSGCPVLGIGQAAAHLATLVGGRFSVVTTLPVSVPVIDANMRRYGFAEPCVSVQPSGLAVIEVESGGPEVVARLSREIAAAASEGAGAVALGCAGMAHLKPELARRTTTPLVDGVAGAALLAWSILRITR